MFEKAGRVAGAAFLAFAALIFVVVAPSLAWAEEGLSDEAGATVGASASDGAVVPISGDEAVVVKDGAVLGSYATLSDAMKNAVQGSTVQLQSDVVLDRGVKLGGKVAGVTLDLNGHDIDGTAVETADGVVCMKTSYGWKPVAGADNTMSIINSVPGQGGSIVGKLPAKFASGDSRYSVPGFVGEGVVLKSTVEGANLVDLGSAAYLVYAATTENLIVNGGFKVTAADGDRIYGSFASAADAAAGDNPVVTMLHDFTTNESLYSGSNSATLDLGGNVYTLTNASAIIDVNYEDVFFTVKNGTLQGTADTVEAGAKMVGPEGRPRANSTLTLDGVTMNVPGNTYGIVTNGATTQNCHVVLRDSTLNVPDGVGIYFPSTGSVTIENSVINAKTSGVQMCAGNLTVTGADTKITVSEGPVEKVGGDGVIEDGAAISIVKREGYQPVGTVVIEAGTFVSAEGVPAVKAYSFSNAVKEEEEWPEAGDCVTIEGGVLSELPANIEELLADGLGALEKDEDGNFVVHEHGWGEFVSDETGHWRVCVKCGVVDGAPVSHSLAVKDRKEPTCGEPGYTGDTACETCGYVAQKGDEIPATGKHEYAEGWSHDEQLHWHACIVCGGQADTGEHSFGDWTVTKEPSAESAGAREHACEVCGFVQGEAIPAIDAGSDEGVAETDKTDSEKGSALAQTGDGAPLGIALVIAAMAAAAGVAAVARRAA